MLDKIISSDTTNYKTNFIIAYSGNLVLYEVPAIEMAEFGTEVDNGRIYKKFKPYDTTFTYYLIKKGNRNGLRFDSLAGGKPYIFKADSLLKALNLDTASLNVYGIDLGKPLNVTKRKNIEIR